MTNCTLCADIGTSANRARWNRPLIETENFVVVPSLGSLVPGWLLIVPKSHYISMGAIPDLLHSEADALEDRTRALLKSEFAEHVIVFEHGPSAANHGTGCGVDHAHLHLVPLNCDLVEQVRPFVPNSLKWKLGNWNERAEAFSLGQDYLYCKHEDGCGVVAVSDDFGSQVFRKAISGHLGMAEKFNWREHPRLETVGQTIAVLTPCLAA